MRPPAVAGSFYPADSRRLAADVDAMVADAVGGGGLPKALIVPHAGYRYSGPVAATAYARLVRARPLVRRVVVCGPAHFVPLDGVGVSSAVAFATPLGDVPVDRAAGAAALALPSVGTADDAHADEHGIEVQLPFLQRLLGDFGLVPLVVGRARPEELADVLDAVDGAPDTLVLASSDLSHYLERSQAEARDRRTAAAVVAGEIDAIGPGDACGAAVLRGLLAWARRHHLRARLLDLRTSTDTAGAPERVVGYGAFSLAPSD